MTNEGTPDLLAALSSGLAERTEAGAGHVVRVDGRRRGPSSGVVWAADGVVVTAHHALERDEEVTVGLPDGTTATCEVAGRDPSTDLAVLRLPGAGLSPVAWVEDPAPRAGQLVLAVSRPGRAPRAALGVIARSAGEYRASRGGKLDRYLETSLDLRPGLSGALALGVDGAALGLVTAGLVRGAAMVVPPATLRRVVKSLLAHGEIRRGYLGIATHPVALPPEARAQTGEELALLVARVEPDSPAARAGILLGDAILAVGEERLQDPGELWALLAEDRIGEAVTLRVLRGGEPRDVQVTVGARPARRA
ncbi:MAG TPA: S1C family serine protease [Anaeromyxobacter sp.]|nr:S1C family serine protease [Anaeromyxobacter sp.]